MRTIALFLILACFSPSAWTQPAISETKVNHAWVQGVYWNPGELPGWGFFVDVQEQTFFGAIYGYMGSDSTFITLQGKLSQLDPLEFRGDVYFVTNGGTTISDVGNFTWRVGYFEATPAGTLSITSNILNMSNLLLVRFSYAEIDDIDIISGADWDIVEHLLITFGENYGVTDERFVEDGITYVAVVNNDEPEQIGVAAYYPPGEGELFGMLVPFDDVTYNFFIFYASDTDMFGRYWFLDIDEEPTGNGSYFHASIATLQDENNGAGVTRSAPGRDSQTQASRLSALNKEQIRQLKDSGGNAQSGPDPMFPQERVLSVFRNLSEVHQARSSPGPVD